MNIADLITDKVLNSSNEQTQAAVSRAVESCETLHEVADRIDTQNYSALTLFGHSPEQAARITARWARDLIKAWADKHNIL